MKSSNSSYKRCSSLTMITMTILVVVLGGKSYYKSCQVMPSKAIRVRDIEGVGMMMRPMVATSILAVSRTRTAGRSGNNYRRT